jgi:hypothetical protein
MVFPSVEANSSAGTRQPGDRFTDFEPVRRPALEFRRRPGGLDAGHAIEPCQDILRRETMAISSKYAPECE